MATVIERTGVLGPSELRDVARDAGRDHERKVARGMEIPRVFSQEGTSPYDEADFELNTAEIKDERGQIIFQQADCEVPRGWSQLATNVVASKYFYGDVATGNGSPALGKREFSVRQLIDRVTRTIADWGRADGYFATGADADRFYDELTALCLNPVRLVQLTGLGSMWVFFSSLRDFRAGQQLAMGRRDSSSGKRRRLPPTNTRKRQPASFRA